jgi:7-carboxy-7-deazaguanine synthase
VIITINRDINATKHDFSEAGTRGMVRALNAFYTYQGEGPWAGWPAIFWRLAGCNIGSKEDCPWCDTKFDLASSREEGSAQLAYYLNNWPMAKMLVITGGEPLLQWQPLVDIIKTTESVRAIRHRSLVIQMETNGLLLREEMMHEAFMRGINFVISPKVPHNRGEYAPIPAWFNSYPSLISLKYVVSADPLSPYHDIPPDAKDCSNRLRTYVSGMTEYKRPVNFGERASLWNDTLIDRESTAGNYAHAARVALEYGHRVSYQTHLLGDVE